ncbi:MAG: hypothetical protein RL365_51 [Bacteroidota bacterium]|jgi:hypothetical protein
MLRSFLFFFLLPSLAFNQTTLMPQVGSERFELHQLYSMSNGDSIRIDQFKWYMSTAQGEIHLVDASEPTSYSFPFSSNAIHLGLDSTANTAGRFDGAYDPLLGMYWSWNTGYIHLKLVGCLVQKGHQFPFEYHIGGYKAPFETFVPIKIPAGTNKILLHLERLFVALPITRTPNIMLPGATAQQIFHAFSTVFE